MVDCKLVEGWRAYLAQGTLVAIVVTALLIKRWAWALIVGGGFRAG